VVTKIQPDGPIHVGLVHRRRKSGSATGPRGRGDPHGYEKRAAASNDAATGLVLLCGEGSFTVPFKG
jgi:hypothetical protein